MKKMKVLSCRCHGVDKLGNVFSKLSGNWKKLKPIRTAGGYYQCYLHRKIWRINRLILTTFVPNPNKFPEAQHRNGIRSDNRICNLKWGSQKDNADDREKHGHTNKGEFRPMAKLKNTQIKKIRALREKGETLLSLANKFKVSKKLILLICQKRIWKHV